MGSPRRFEISFRIAGQERPTRHDGLLEVEQAPLLNGEVRLDVDGRAEFLVRLTDASPAEWSQTMDEFEETLTRLKLAVAAWPAGDYDEDDD